MKEVDQNETMKMALYKNDINTIQKLIEDNYDINTISVSKKLKMKGSFFYFKIKKSVKYKIKKSFLYGNI
jgi:hypothetical protein